MSISFLLKRYLINICKYLNKIFLSHDRKAGNLRVYHQKIFVFTSDNILVTILQLPSQLFKIEKKDLEVRSKKSQEELSRKII